MERRKSTQSWWITLIIAIVAGISVYVITEGKVPKIIDIGDRSSTSTGDNQGNTITNNGVQSPTDEIQPKHPTQSTDETRGSTPSPVPATKVTSAPSAPAPERPAVPMTSTQAPPPTSKPGDVLYQADWSKGMSGWPALTGWGHVSNMLVSDGSSIYPTGEWLPAPYQPDTPDYAVEADIQLLNKSGGYFEEFGIIARAEGEKGIVAGSDHSSVVIGTGSHFSSKIASQAFDTGQKWHTYRLEVQGNVIKLSVDGVPMLEAADNHYLSSGKVGIFTIDAQINVRSFKVIKL